MRFAVCLTIFSGLILLKAIQSRGIGMLLYWASFSFAVVAVAYAGVGPCVFGKRPDGTVNPVSVVLLFPYLALVWLVWHAWRILSPGPPYHTLCDGVMIGRRLLPRDYPDEVSSIVDLTCEFPERARIRAGRTYRCFATLDGGAPDVACLQEIVREVEELPQTVYIHCANGHGRSGTVAAALLLARGEAGDAVEAEKRLRERRPRAHLNSMQRRAVRDFARAAGDPASSRHAPRVDP